MMSNGVGRGANPMHDLLRRVSRGSLAFAVVLVAGHPGSVPGQGGDREAFERARALVYEGEADRAVSTFTRLVETGDPELGRLAMRALIEVGRYDEAASAASRFHDSHPDTGERWNGVGEILLLRGEIDEAVAAFARAIAGGAVDSAVAELNLALVDYERGQRAAALERFDRFIDLYNGRSDLSSEDLFAVATAVRFLGVRDHQLFQDAVRAYDEAIAADPHNLTARVAVAELFLDKYNNTEATATIRDALGVNGHHPGAILALARSLHFDGSPEALNTVRRSLEINPQFVPARTFVASLLLESEAYDDAETEARRALQINPGSLPAMAVLAAVEFLRGAHDAFAEIEREILTRNAGYAELYNTLADVSARNRRYAEAAEFARRAVALDSTSWRAYGFLGMNQLRLGQIEDGRRHLEAAFAGDPYNVWIKNTLDLVDTFAEYEVVSTPRFRLVLHGDERGTLGIYLGRLAEEAFDRFTARYEYTPPTPIRIEVYPRHADFSVRTVGLAGLGALGVSFGPVIAMDSPSARDVGDFNWGSTLWHELAHTFHLGMTDHRVPRWFSEGLAVHEERQAREGWGGDVSPSFLGAYRDGRLPPVSRLNDGFVRPSYPEQVIHSYFLASLVFEWIEDEWGFAAVRRMLLGYRAGRSNAEVVRDVLGLGLDEFDERFDTFFKTRFTHALVALGDPPAGGTGQRPSPEEILQRARDESSFAAQFAAGRVLYDQERYDEALPFFERAQTLFPEYAQGNSPYWYIASIHRRRGSLDRAAGALQQLIDINENHYQAHLDLARMRVELGDSTAAAATLQRAMYIYPLQIDTHERLAELYGAIGEWSFAAREREAVIGLRPVDMAEARYQLARALFYANQHAAARREVLRALEMAPNYLAAQELLLEIRAARRPSGGVEP